MKTTIGNILPFFMLICAAVLLAPKAQGQINDAAGSAAIEARLRGDSDGSVTVLFHGTVGTAYRIEYTDAPPREQSLWITGAENIMAQAGWTEWTDISAATVGQRFYRVSRQSDATPPPITPPLVITNAVLPPPAEATGLHYAADAGTVQTAHNLAEASWARLQEASDAGKLVGALGAGKPEEALQVLREYGVTEATLNQMAARLGQAPKRSSLKDPFLRGVVALHLSDPVPAVQHRFQTARGQGRGKLYWTVKSLGPGWELLYDRELAQLPEPPMAVLDVKLQEVDVIRFFKWYDRYADKVHSVLLNSDQLSNWGLKRRYADADLVMAALFKLIKARHPDAFVWARVVWQEDQSDARWLQALTFRPDGLVIWNLHSFLSPFDQARTKYAAIVGETTPMLVAEFYGFWPELTKVSDLKPMGQIIQDNLSRFEERMQREWGYCGLLVNWKVVEALEREKGK